MCSLCIFNTLTPLHLRLRLLKDIMEKFDYFDQVQRAVKKLLIFTHVCMLYMM